VPADNVLEPLFDPRWRATDKSFGMLYQKTDKKRMAVPIAGRRGILSTVSSSSADAHVPPLDTCLTSKKP
jgi:hypothetical protein